MAYQVSSGPRRVRREVPLQSPPRRPPRPEAERRAVELGYVLWTPQSVELRTERHQARMSTFGYRLYASVVFHGLQGTDRNGMRYIWPHACRRRDRRGELLPPHVTVIRGLEATAEEIDHLSKILDVLDLNAFRIANPEISKQLRMNTHPFFLI